MFQNVKSDILQQFPLVLLSTEAARENLSHLCLWLQLCLSQSYYFAVLHNSGLDKDNKYSFMETLRYNFYCHWRQ